MISASQSQKAFIAVCIPLCIAKFWQETLYLFSYFLVSDLQTPAVDILSIAKYQPLGVALGYILTAFFVDKVGIKKILSAGLLFFATFAFFFAMMGTIHQLLFLRFALGFCMGMVYNCSFGALSIIFSHEELPKKTSIMYLFAFGSTVFSPVILTNSQYFISWRILIIITGILTTGSSLLIWKFFPHKTSKMTFQSYISQLGSLIRNKVFMYMSIISTLCMGGFYGFVCIFAHNLKILNYSNEVSKFVVTDIQFVARSLLFITTTWSSRKLTQKTIPTYLRFCLTGMAVVAMQLLYSIIVNGSAFGVVGILSSIASQASQGKHVITLLLSTFSGVWMFWLYAAAMGIAQPANKARALSVAGKDMGGTAQAILGFSLAFGEFVFAAGAQYQWPYGAITFLLFVCISAFFAVNGLKNKI